MNENSVTRDPAEPEATLVKFHVSDIAPNSNTSVRTFCIFLDLPKHIEFRVDGIPLLQIGDVVEFDLEIKNPRDITKIRKLNGPYYISKRILKYSSTHPGAPGFSQYLEWQPVPNEPVRHPVNR